MKSPIFLRDFSPKISFRRTSAEHDFEEAEAVVSDSDGANGYGKKQMENMG